jgi:hypothetical protein
VSRLCLDIGLKRLCRNLFQDAEPLEYVPTQSIGTRVGSTRSIRTRVIGRREKILLWKDDTEIILE